MQLCVTLIVTHRTPGTRQHESGWYQCSGSLDPMPGGGLPVAMGPAISGCITSECSHGLYSGWLATVCGLVTVVAVPVTVRREPAWPGQPGTGRGIPSNTQQHYSTHAAYTLILQQNFAKCSQYCIGHIRYFTARH